MIFTTYWFSLFAVVYFPLFWMATLRWLRLGLLLAACFTFHAHFAGAAGMLPIIILATTTYLAGIWRNRTALVGAMVLPVTALAFYKYTHFIALSVVALLNPAWGEGADHFAGSLLPITPPLAVSFFVFEFVHYLYDVRKGAPSIRNPAFFCAFTFFFPSLVAGPIKRYQPYLASLHSGLGSVGADDVKLGVMRVALGLFKKLVIADNVTAALKFWQPQYPHLTLLSRWEFVLAIGVRILFDFSGYSDIAIGLARMMGITLPENFRWPYLATSVTEFWHRWHISLSTWVRDYVYVPLGGSRHGVARKILNGLIAFALCGLWHGPSWNFAFWGLYHGTGLAVSSNYEAVLGRPGSAIARFFSRVPLAGWALTLAFVLVGWLYFFYPVADATHMARLLFDPAR
jgi:alginate O-acetyltransferase complex protein AlgI